MYKIDKNSSSNANDAYSLVVISLVLAIHLLPIFAFFTPFSLNDVCLFLVSYALRVFALTAGYHRYFSHKAFETNRFFQFFLAYFAACSLQGGPLWWASHHRHHHHTSDENSDVHSPVRSGFFHSHFLWFMQKKNLKAHYCLIKDFSQVPELRMLERYWYLAPLPMMLILYLIGDWNYIVWGFFVPTLFVNNVTYCVNSLVHLYGNRPYKTQDHSKNNWWVALLTFGEGWHNNHHRYAGSANQGFCWYQIDITYYLLKMLSTLRIVKNLKKVPSKILKEGGY
jgi:stearoyl-CoA desaturase (delta-9 desaturase)